MNCPSCSAAIEDDAESCFHCGHTAIRKGVVVDGRYEILERLGKGGMGAVYRAFDRRLEVEVALKFLLTGSQSPDLTKRFRSEIKLARMISHRNVCRIHDYGEQDGRPYISMELIEGTDLKRLIRQRGPLPKDEAFDIALQVARGLDAIHEAGIIHRDLKTPNLMLDPRGVVRLMDFGIAKRFASEGASATRSGQIIGTPEYMSPEQARGSKVDFRSDIYALGIIVFELFTGDVPFRGDTPVATILKHLQEAPPLDLDGSGLIPPPVLPVLRRALAKDPGDRYQTVAEIEDALRQARVASLSEGQSPSFEIAAPVGAVVPAMPPKPDTVPVAAHTVVPTPVPTPVPTGAGDAGLASLVLPAEAKPKAAEDVTEVVAKRAEPQPTGPLPALPQAEASPPAPPESLPAGHPPALPTPAPAIARGRGRPGWLLPAAGLLLLGSFGLALLYRSRPGLSPPAWASPAPVTAALTPVSTAPAPTPTPQAARESPADGARPEPRIATTPPPVRRSPPPSSRPTPHFSPASRAHEIPPQPGQLQCVVRPWGEVRVDGKTVGTTPFRPVSLPPGTYLVEIEHPEFQPLQRRVQITAGSTVRVEVDLNKEAVPRR